MKRSVEFKPGIYQFEWREQMIDVVEWNEPPTSTTQWVQVEGALWDRFYLQGTSNDDIKVVRAETEIEFFSTSG